MRGCAGVFEVELTVSKGRRQDDGSVASKNNLRKSLFFRPQRKA